jgi:hypothetical protein
MVSLAAAAFTANRHRAVSGDGGETARGRRDRRRVPGYGDDREEASNVRGLTAAGIWAVSSIGGVVGAGEYLIGVGLTAMIMLILTWNASRTCRASGP